MKKMTLARALETRNRISNEIHCLWEDIQKENSCREDKDRSIDIRKALMIIELYTEKLVDLKTKIGQASAGNLAAIHQLEEYKNRMAMLEAINTDEAMPYYLKLCGHNGVPLSCNVVLSQKEIDNMKTRLCLRCNTLQKEIEDYNARTEIDFDMPLGLEEWTHLANARHRPRE